MTSVERQ